MGCGNLMASEFEFNVSSDSPCTVFNVLLSPPEWSHGIIRNCFLEQESMVQTKSAVFTTNAIKPWHLSVSEALHFRHDSCGMVHRSHLIGEEDQNGRSPYEDKELTGLSEKHRRRAAMKLFDSAID